MSNHVHPILPNEPGVAGVQIGDLIVRVEDDEVRTAQDLQALVSTRAPGEVVRLTVMRPPTAEPFTTTITLESLPVPGAGS